MGGSLTHKHPSLWKLIDGLKVTENRARKKLVEYRRGDTLHQRAAYKRVTERLYNLVERYDSSMPMEEKIKFVKSVANLIDPKLFCITLFCPNSILSIGYFVHKLICPTAVLTYCYYDLMLN